ncbi:MAG: hypothetical protein JXQ96_17320 [Cyclobacteriaceae bacterium]
MKEEKKLELVSLLQKEELMLEDNSLGNNEKLDLLNSIVYLKSKLGHKIYVDVKRMLDHYVRTLHDRSSGYDQLNIDVIDPYLGILPVQQGLYILVYFQRVLEREGYEVPSKLQDKQSNLEIVYHLEAFEIKRMPRFLHLVLTYNIYILTYFIFVVLLIPAIMFYPENEQGSSYSITEVQYTNDQIVNGVLNAVAGYYELDDRVKIYSKGFVGLTGIIILKLIHLLLIINYLFNTFLRRIGNL